MFTKTLEIDNGKHSQALVPIAKDCERYGYGARVPEGEP